MVNTVFTIKGLDETFDVQVEGSGQETCSAVLKMYRRYTVIIKGFINPTNNTFLPVKIKF